MGGARAVLFDCDGVLVDSEVLSMEVELAALRSVGVDLDLDGLGRRYVGMSAADQTAAVQAEFGVDLPPAWWDRLFTAAEAAVAERVTAVPGIRQVVEGLAVPYALASSSSHARIEVSLRTAGLLDLFPRQLRHSSQDVTRGKPAPDLFLRAAAALDVDPAAVVVVEDSRFGVQAALTAGMAVIGFSGGGHAGPAWGERLAAAGAPVVAGDAAALERHLAALLADG